MLTHPQVVCGGADGGAHVGFLQEASNSTYLLTHWARDRRRGSGNLPLEFVVRKQCMETARLFGMEDRGMQVPKPGAHFWLLYRGLSH